METVLHEVEYLFPDEDYYVSREEQDHQEAMFQFYQTKLHNGTIKKSERDILFTIIHNCTMSQIKRRIGNLKKKYGIGVNYYTAEMIEEMSLDGTLRLMKSMVVRKRYVRYIIKTADYLALYEMYNAKKKFSDLVFCKGMSLESYKAFAAEVDDIDIDENGNVKIKRNIKTKGEL